MSADLRKAADAAKAEHERLIQVRRVAEFEYNTACTESRKADKRREAASNALKDAQTNVREANEKADAAFFKLAEASMANTGKVQG